MFIDFSTEVLPYFMGRINTFHNDIYHRDIGTIESFLTAQWECPNTMTIPAHIDDSWRVFCEKNSGGFSSDMLNSLADALQREVIPWTGNEADCSSFLAGENEKIFAVNEEPDLLTLVRCIDKMGLRGKDPLVFLPHVHAGFSSKRILAEQGLKSLAICAGSAK